jgi:L-methionine (R)-S-oxide reductase
MNQIFTAVYTQFDILYANTKNLQDLLKGTAQLLQTEISHYDWVGFYILDNLTNELVLGPFQGTPTEHTHIPVGKGICGQVAVSKQTMIVQDVTKQDNYLACSMDVQSEIVVPVIKNGLFVAEIDIDSHSFAPFTAEDEIFLSTIAVKLSEFF